MSIGYKHIDMYFDILRANLVDSDIRSDLSIRRQLGFTEVLNSDCLEFFNFLGEGSDSAFNFPPQQKNKESKLCMALARNISVSGTINSLKILRKGVLGSLLDFNWDITSNVNGSCGQFEGSEKP